MDQLRAGYDVLTGDMLLARCAVGLTLLMNSCLNDSGRKPAAVFVAVVALARGGLPLQRP